MTEIKEKERKRILGIHFFPKKLETAAANKTADFEKDKEGVIKELKELISRMKPKAKEEISKISRFANWEEFIKENFKVIKRRSSWSSGLRLSKESKEELEKERKNLCDYANELHSLVRIENRLLISNEEAEITKIEEVKEDLKEILKLKNFQTVSNLSKNGENYRKIITDTISQLEEKIKVHQEEAESPIGEEDLGHESTAGAERKNLTVKTNNEIFLVYRHPSSSLEIEVAKEGGRVDENGQIELPWERGTEINHVSILGWEEFEGIVEKLRFRTGERIKVVTAEIKGIKVDKCWVEDMDVELNPGKKRLKIPAWACQSIEFTKEGETFPYDITAEEVKDPDLVRLDELKEKATDLYQKIINTTETAEFDEETIGKWFKRAEEIKFESGSIVLKLKEAEKTAGNRKSAEIKIIFEKRLFRDKREYFLEKAENFYIEKIEKLGRKDEQINNINFIKEGHYDDWKDYIREQDTISGIMKCANDDLLPAVQVIPLAADRAETELVEEEVREEVEVDVKVKKSLQTLGLEVGVSEFEIRKAYRELSLQHHPEKEGGSIEDQTKYQEVQEAYKLLAADFLDEDKIFFDYSNEEDLKELEDLKKKDYLFSYNLEQEVENDFKRVLGELKPNENERIVDFMLSEQREMFKNWPRHFYWFYFLNGEKNYKEIDAWIKENIRESAYFIKKSKIFFEQTKKSKVFKGLFSDEEWENKRKEYWEKLEDKRKNDKTKFSDLLPELEVDFKTELINKKVESVYNPTQLVKVINQKINDRYGRKWTKEQRKSEGLWRILLAEKEERDILFLIKILEENDDTKVAETLIEYYEILGIDLEEPSFDNPFPGEKITKAQVKKAYMSKSLELHPDKGRKINKELRTILLNKIQEANECLSNSHHKNKYDHYLWEVSKDVENNEGRVEKKNFTPNQSMRKKFSYVAGNSKKVDNTLAEKMISLLGKELEVKKLTWERVYFYAKKLNLRLLDLEDYRTACQKEVEKPINDLIHLVNKYLGEFKEIFSSAESFEASGITQFVEWKLSPKNNPNLSEEELKDAPSVSEKELDNYEGEKFYEKEINKILAKFLEKNLPKNRVGEIIPQLEEMAKEILVKRIVQKRKIKRELIKKLEEDYLKKGNEITDPKEGKTFHENFNNYCNSIITSADYETKIIGKTVFQENYETEIKSLISHLESLEKEEEESGTTNFDDSSTISNEEKKEFIKYLDDLILNSVPSEIKGLVKARKTVFSGEEPIDYSSKINNATSKHEAEKVRARIIDTVHYYVSSLKGGSGEPDEAKKILTDFSQKLQKEIEAEQGAKLIDKQKTMLEVNLDEGKNTSARELTESKRKIISQMAANEDELTAVEEGGSGEVPNPVPEQEEEENREDIPLPEEPVDTLTQIKERHQKDLLELFSKEERKEWSNYLDKLKNEEETPWLKNDENAVVYLHKLAVNGYLPSDEDKLSFLKTRYRKNNVVYFFYHPDSKASGSLNAFEWKKEAANAYWPLKRDYLNKIDEIEGSEYWKEIFKGDCSWVTPTSAIENTILDLSESEKSSSEELEKKIKEIKNLARRELAYLRTSDEEEWKNHLITEETLKKIFYGEEGKLKLEDKEIENRRQLLTDIQTILTKNEDNIKEGFLANDEWGKLNNSLTNTSEDLKKIIENADYELLQKALLTRKYFEYYNIDEIEIGKLETARQVYKEVKINKESDADAGIKKTILENIHGENWQQKFTTKRKKVKLASVLLDWKENKYFENTGTLKAEDKEKIKKWWGKKNRKYQPTEWDWAKNKVEIAQEKIEELKKAVGAKREFTELSLLLFNNKDITYEEFRKIWQEIENEHSEEINKKINQSWAEEKRKELLKLEIDWLFENAAAEKKTVEELENYRKRIELFESDFLNEPTSPRAAIWKEKNGSSVPPSPVSPIFSLLNSAVDVIKNAATGNSKKGKLDEKLNKLTERINTLKNWENEANEGLTALRTKAVQEVWTKTELTAFQNEIKNYPPCREKTEEKKIIYHRDFQQIYREKKWVEKQLEQIKNLAQGNANEYQKIEEKINGILNKNINENYNKLLPYTVEKPAGSSSPGFCLNLEDIKKDLQKLRRITPFSKDRPAASLGGEMLSLVHQKVFANNRDRILERSLWLEKNEYLEEPGEELTDFEKSCVREKETKPELDDLKTLIRKWKIEVLPGQPIEIRQLWQKYFNDNWKIYWKNAVGLKQLENLATNNWDKYFTDEEKLIKLKTGFILEYESVTGSVRKVSVLTTNYLTLQSWDNFYGEHGITNEDDWKTWEKSFANSEVAKKSYTDALKALDGFPWSSELSEGDRAKINQAKNPKDIVVQQKEVAWDQFFRVNRISNSEPFPRIEQAWKELSGLNVQEAQQAVQKGWAFEISERLENWKGKGKFDNIFLIKSVKTMVVEDIEILKHDCQEIRKVLDLWDDIDSCDNLDGLRALQSRLRKYDQEQVPSLNGWWRTQELWESKKLKLFKTAFEGGEPSGITENADYEAWLNASLDKVEDIKKDYVVGKTERKIYDLGWKKPDQIKSGYTNYREKITRDGSQIEISWNNVPVWKIDREKLKLALDLKNDAERQTDTKGLDNFISHCVAEYDNLNSDLLPDGLKREDLFNFIDTKYRNLKKQEFKKDFRKKGGEAALATDEEIENYFVICSNNTPPYYSLQFSDKDSAQLFNNGWRDVNELNVDPDNKTITAEIRGETCFEPLGKERSEFENHVWIKEFWNGNLASLGNEEVLEYRKSSLIVPAATARQVFERHWTPKQFDWNGTSAIVPAYTSPCGKTDTNLDASVIDREELDKVNQILYNIEKATVLNDLPPEKEITSYKKNQVPLHKDHDKVKTLWKNRKIKLEKDTSANKQARISTIQAVNNWRNKLGINGNIETVCGNDWKKKFDNLQGADIAAEENRLKNLISQAKVKPDIEAIENELNKKPVIPASELKNSDYKGKMIGLAADDAQRKSKKNEIITEITQIRENKLNQLRQLIASAQTIKDKEEATKEEVEGAINDLKTLANAPTDSAEQIIWEEKKDNNQKLLTDLEEKLSKITPPEPEKEEPDKPQIPTPPPSPTPQEEKEKFGEDYAELKPTQQEGRQKIVENWKKEKNYERSKTCRYCPQEFHYDKSLEYLPAKQEAEKKLEEHEATCSIKSNQEETKKVKQAEWEKIKKTKTRYFYACRKCWGKIELDKGIADWEEAKKQGRADVVYHEDHECGSEENKKIAIYFSPNQGGNGHAPLDYGKKINENELTLEKDNQGEVYQNQENNKDNGTDWTPWIIGGSIIGVLIAGSLTIINLKKGRKQQQPKKKKINWKIKS